MVRHIDNGLLGASDKLSFVLHDENRSLLPALFRNPTDGIQDLNSDLAGEALVAVLASQGELDGLAAGCESGEAWDLGPDADGARAVPHALAPADLAAVQGVGPVVGQQLVRLPGVQRPDPRPRDAVRHPPDRLPEVRAVVRHVLLLRREPLHDVDPADFEGLDDGAQGQEGDFVGHFLGLFVCLFS